MHLFRLLSILVLTSTAAAITIEFPDPGYTWDLSKGPITLKWSSLLGDPSTFRIKLAHHASPFYDEVVALNVATPDEQYTVEPRGIPPNTGYQFEFLSTSDSSNIVLARSWSFSIEGEAPTAGVSILESHWGLQLWLTLCCKSSTTAVSSPRNTDQTDTPPVTTSPATNTRSGISPSTSSPSSPTTSSSGGGSTGLSNTAVIVIAVTLGGVVLVA